MKFYPRPILRFYYRYIFILIFIIFPIYVSCGMAFDEQMVKTDERLHFVLLGLILLFSGVLIINFAFLESFFATLEITDNRVIWRCPFRKTQRMLLNDCVVIGACREHTKKGIPSECIYFSTAEMPMIDTDLHGALKRSDCLIKYAYSDKLCDYLIQKIPNKRTRALGAYRCRRKALR